MEDTGSGAGRGSSRPKAGAEPEHKDFWDSFGAPVTEDHSTARPAKSGMSGRNSPVKQGRASPAPGKGNAIGTAAMRKGAKEKEEDKWEDF